MLRVLFSRVPFLRQLLSHRNAQLKADSDERRARWNEVIAKHQKPVAPPKETSMATGAIIASPPE